MRGKIQTHKTPTVVCPCCKKILDAATGIDARNPSPGDFSICVYCKTWLIYTNDLGLRTAQDEDVAKLKPTDLELLKYFTQSLMEGGI